jgi:ADP-ribose pyrophosphatase
LKNFKLSNNIELINKPFKKKEFYHYLKTSNLSIVIPKINNKYILVSQKRIPINKINFEFPSGIIEKNETPLMSAKKELIEETGYKSRNKLIKITSFYTEPGRLTTKITGFLCNNLIKISKPEKGIKIHMVSDQQIIKLIKNGKFNNASHIGMFLFYKKKYAR